MAVVATDTATGPQPAPPSLPVTLTTPWFRPAGKRHAAVADYLRALIESGQYRPGEKVPGITALCKDHRCSRRTISKALRILELEKLIERFLGQDQGYYVCRHP